MSLSNLFAKLSGGKTPQGKVITQKHRDYLSKGDSFSVESEISESLADLTLYGSQLPIQGDTERAKWLDSVADDFMRTYAADSISSGLLTGDCLVVPSWNGRNVQHLIVDNESFVIYECAGDEILSCAYVLDTRLKRGRTYKLMQFVELIETEDGFKNAYTTRVLTDSGAEFPLSDFPDWEQSYERYWEINGVDKLLVGRFKSFTRDPQNVNNAKGSPICFGAGEFIAEIHYLMAQMHNEYGFSEKAIMASKRMFEEVNEDGRERVTLPRGRKRLFMFTNGQSRSGDNGNDISEWAPDIRYQAYLEGLNEQFKAVERAVGVSSGIISTPNDVNYENVDNVRKSQQKTMGFISKTRKQAESMLDTLIYTWNVLANYYEITPMGEYSPSYDWSDDYIETFADKQNAILAGNSIGATDAVDYRMWLYNESYETASDRVAEIQANMFEVVEG